MKRKRKLPTLQEAMRRLRARSVALILLTVLSAALFCGLLLYALWPASSAAAEESLLQEWYTDAPLHPLNGQETPAESGEEKRQLAEIATELKTLDERMQANRLLLEELPLADWNGGEAVGTAEGISADVKELSRFMDLLLDEITMTTDQVAELEALMTQDTERQAEQQEETEKRYTQIISAVTEIENKYEKARDTVSDLLHRLEENADERQRALTDTLKQLEAGLQKEAVEHFQKLTEGMEDVRDDYRKGLSRVETLVEEQTDAVQGDYRRGILEVVSLINQQTADVREAYHKSVLEVTSQLGEQADAMRSSTAQLEQSLRDSIETGGAALAERMERMEEVYGALDTDIGNLLGRLEALEEERQSDSELLRQILEAQREAAARYALISEHIGGKSDGEETKTDDGSQEQTKQTNDPAGDREQG